jgi:hypothetical protein
MREQTVAVLYIWHDFSELGLLKQIIREVMMKKTSPATAAIFAVMILFTSAVWAGELPTVKMNGSVAVFPAEDKISNLDLSKFEIGKGLENIPSELKFMVGKWWRGQFSVISRRGGTQAGSVMYISPIRFEDNKTDLLIASSRTGSSNILCPSNSNEECVMKNTASGSAESFVRFKLLIKNGKPVLSQLNTAEAEFQEAGVLPKEILQK